MKDFEYFRPKTIDEAVSLYREGGKGARLLAGGTELVNEIRFGKSQPDLVVDLKHIRELDFMHPGPEGVSIGALYRVGDAEHSRLLLESRYNAISHAAGTLGSPQVRNKATIVGNVCRASPSADLIPPLMALGAMARIVGDGTERSVPVEDMLVGPGRTVLNMGEIVTELEIPDMPDYSGCSYYKLSPRKSLDLAVVGAAVMIRTDPRVSRCIDARIVLGAVAPTSMRAKRAEAMLIGAKPRELTIDAAAQAAAEDSKPLDDVRASAWYRKRMVEVVVRRTIGLALEQVKTRR
ncbi:FAD binding domain-containing protein [Syntrophorhabdus aromaticivorans]|uniref:FAD binding domain-containing protein n=1 Tax=Syntrophorhabdus aromaticivorans TaxID=328301 RepID=UPI000417DB98|nr:xanthine dehydrogenase family protein subunit M [Syntrophorhabdus aromaticivorans]